MRGRLAGGMAAILALGACGGSTFKKVDPAADLAHAQASVLTETDVPNYTSAPHDESDDTPAAVQQQLATCLHTSTSLFADQPGAQKANSPDFTHGEGSIENSVTINPKKSDVDDDWKAVSRPDIIPCLQQYFESAVRAGLADTPGVDIGTPTIAQFDPAIGDRSIGFALRFTVRGSASTSTLFSDLILATRDRAELSLEVFDVNTALDRHLEVSLAQRVYDRIGDGAK